MRLGNQRPVNGGKDAGSSAGRTRALTLLILIGILLIAAQLRFTGLNWDEGQYIHPDEGHMRNTLSLIRWPDDLSLYFDTHRSPLNVRNREGHRYSYGTLPLFTVRAAAEWLDGACTESPSLVRREAAKLLAGSDVEGCRPGTFTGAYNAVVGRALSGLADLGTLVLIFLIGRRLYGEITGLLAAGLGAVTAFLIQQAHFFTVDSVACLFVTLAAYFAVRAAGVGQSQGVGGDAGRAAGDEDGSPEPARWFDFGAAGLAVGLAAACKVSAATAALLVMLATAQSVIRRVRIRESRERGEEARGLGSRWWIPLAALCLAGLLSLAAFRVAQPYAFEGPGFFGVRPSPEWFGRLQQIREEQSGGVDLPSGRQWANRTAIVFPWLNIVVWGMGIPLGLAAWIGWGAAGVDLLLRRDGRRHAVLWGWFTVVFLYHAIQWVKSMRYFLALYPILLLYAAFWMVRLAKSVSKVRRWIGVGAASLVTLGAVLWGVAFFTIYLRPHTRVAASRWIFEHVPDGATVANEHWDWGLPLRIDGHNPFGGEYVGVEMTHYDEDTPEKRERLYGWLHEADWIFLASNRLYGSIPRLPSRYPLTTEYYRALFAGELGFELEADFTSYPALGLFVFPDQENPFELMEANYVSQEKPVTVDLPPAEEAFSVYDHPRVLIFRKTEAYSRNLVQEVLGGIPLDRVQRGRTPREATAAPDMLRFDEETWREQKAGGTWSRMFNRGGALNRYPWLGALAWWAAVTVLGWAAFPLLFASLPGLRDRGYGFARLFALLTLAYLTWVAASVRLLPNTQGTILRMMGLLALVGGSVGWLRREDIRAFVKRRWRMMVVVEVLFAVLFAAWIGVRMLQPDLWHAVVGGEKPMDFAYLNAVMKSTWFPPYNPWLSGTWINYYYFGFVLVGTLIKLMGTVPAVAYNLAVPLLFALTAVGAFSSAFNLFGGAGDAKGERRALMAGVAGTLFAVVLGNLGVVHLLRNQLIQLGGVSFPSTIPGFPRTVSFFRGLWRVGVRGAEISMRPETWYWHPTRIIPGSTGNPIAEFPAFTFLYGDLHAHMIALPLTLFALTLAVGWARGSRRRWASLVVGGLVIGALRPTNTWDYPTYLLLGVVSLGVGAWRVYQGVENGSGGSSSDWASGTLQLVRRLVWEVPILVGLSLLLYRPYAAHYVAGYDAVSIWKGGHTPLGIYLWIHAALLLPVVTRMGVELRAILARGRAVRRAAWLALAVGLVAGVVFWVLDIRVGLAAAPVMSGAVVLFFAARESEVVSERERGEPAPPSPTRLLWVLVAGAMALSLAVEVVVLEGDIGRMNTVFKFYLQVWILLAVAGAVSLVWLLRRAQGWEDAPRQLWFASMSALVVGGLLFLPFGIRARAIDRIAPETGCTLDGMAFVEHAVIQDGPEGALEEVSLRGDYHAIRWLQDHVEGSPVIMEGLGRREYLWANRVSVHTGLPAVVGWRWHQVQQRAGVGGEMVQWRRADVDACYSTVNLEEARGILKRYDVRYLYVGPYERAYYPRMGLAKFDVMAEEGILDLVYDTEGVQIYDVVDAG